MAIEIPPIQPPATGVHSGHGGGNAVSSVGGGQSFPSVLSQAINKASDVGGHGGHAETSSPSAQGQTGGTHSTHLPIGNAKHAAEHDFQEKALEVRAYRQELIASNIANADTPNYKAVDIDVQEALRIAQSGSQASPLSMAVTATGHIPGQAPPTTPPYPLKYRIPTQPSLDGNTVDMNVEQAKFSENALMYQFTMDRVGGHFKHMMELLRDLK